MIVSWLTSSSECEWWRKLVANWRLSGGITVCIDGFFSSDACRKQDLSATGVVILYNYVSFIAMYEYLYLGRRIIGNG